MRRSKRDCRVLTHLLNVFFHLRIFGHLGQQTGYQFSAALAIMLIDLLFDIHETVWSVLKLMSPLFDATLRLRLKGFDSLRRTRDQRSVF